MAKKQIQKNELIPIEAKEVLLTDMAVKNVEPATRETIVNLLREAFKQHDILCNHIGDAVYAGVGIGRNLRAVEPLVPHGSHISFVTEHFCKPLGVSTRTIQRYAELSTDFDVVVKRLRAENGEFSDIDEREFLRGRSFNECRYLIRKLLSNEAIDPTVQTQDNLPQPDENDWSMPDSIVKRILDVTPVIDVDPFAIHGINTYAAVSTISKPSNGLAKDVAWEGNVVLNPGLKGTSFGDLADRVILEFNAATIKEAFVFVPASMNSKYAYRLREFPRVFNNKFLHVSGPAIRKTIKTPMMLVFVSHRERFNDFFRAFDDPNLFDSFSPVFTK